jgi:CTP synthase (UTP-ammonia lyase)
MKFYDIIVPKTYEVPVGGTAEKRTTWNRVGRAWKAKTGDSLRFELFLLPGHSFLISLKERPELSNQPKSAEELAEDFASFLASDQEAFRE